MPNRATRDEDVDAAASRLYLAMVRTPEPSVHSLALVGFDAAQVRRVAPVLVERGLVTQTGADRWHVLPPEPSLARLATDLEAQARFARASAAELGAIWRRVHGAPPREGPEMLEVLDTTQAIGSAMGSLRALATASLRCFVGGSPTSRPLLEGPGLDLTADRDLSAQLLVDTEVLQQPGMLDAVEARARQGYQVKVSAPLPFSGIVVDGAVLVDLTGAGPTAEPWGLMSRLDAGIAAVSRLFDMLFDVATPLQPVAAARRQGEEGVVLAPRDARVLALLAAGASDQAIARQVGASSRTVERRVRHLMDVLGAGTRFQAGVQAALRGWLD